MVRTRAAAEPALAGLLVMLVILSLSVGIYPVPLRHLPAIIASAADPSLPVVRTERAVVLLVRAPRIMTATFAGATLGLAGATLQGLFRNPLVGPDIVGVSAGAALGAAVAILAALGPVLIVASAFAGGLTALAATLALAALVRGAGTLGLLLSGLVVSAFSGAGLSLAEITADPSGGLGEVVFWLAGGFAGADRTKLATLLIAGAVPFGLLLMARWRLNVLAGTDEDELALLDSRLPALRWSLVIATAWLIAAQVAVSGVVGWIGLVAPHAARMTVGPDHRRLLPASALVGALVTLGADLLARLNPGGEIPVGVTAAIVGAPAFAFLFWRTQGRGWHG